MKWENFPFLIEVNIPLKKRIINGEFVSQEYTYTGYSIDYNLASELSDFSIYIWNI